MKTLRVLVALLTNDNDYQIEQANSATQMASKLGVEAKIVYADNDAINQSTQILKAIQAAPRSAPMPSYLSLSVGRHFRKSPVRRQPPAWAGWS